MALPAEVPLSGGFTFAPLFAGAALQPGRLFFCCAESGQGPHAGKGCTFFKSELSQDL